MSIITEIQSKLKNATPAQLTAILEIINKVEVPIVIAPKKRAPNAWVEYLSTYKLSHPDETHKQAMVNALKLYKAKPVVAVVEKKVKTCKVIECSICGFQPANKSNLNRHMKTAHTREKTMGTIVKVKGLVARYTKRVESKNPEVKAEAVEKLKEAGMLKIRIAKALALLPSEPKKASEIQTKKTVTPPKPKTATLPKTLIDDINKTYMSDNGVNLNITQKNIKSVTKDDNKYTVDTVNVNAEDEQIDQMIIISDDMGYDVYFMQKVKMKDKKEVMSEIDSIFIYI
jgi:formylmethanofuran dehydrogenase subunit E